MTLKSLYKEYFQKSKIFLYSALFDKKLAISPIQTYVAWEDHYTVHDKKLICLFYLREDEEFVVFEKKYLLNHHQFFDFKQIDDKQGAYIFDFSMHAHDWNCFLKGQYSLMSEEHKIKIATYYEFLNKRNGKDKITDIMVYIDSYINPHKYFEMYSGLLGTTAEDLRRVGQLCNIPDIERETLTSDIKSIIIKQENYEQIE